VQVAKRKCKYKSSQLKTVSYCVGAIMSVEKAQYSWHSCDGT